MHHKKLYFRYFAGLIAILLLFSGCTNVGTPPEADRPVMSPLPPNEETPPSDETPSSGEQPPSGTPSSTLSLWTKQMYRDALTGALLLPQSSSQYDRHLAKQLLPSCALQLADEIALLHQLNGFSVIKQAHYDDNSTEHISAYTLSGGIVQQGDSRKKALLLTLRSTANASGWYSNFDFSGDEDSFYATNFLTAAQSIFDEIKLILEEQDKDTLLLINGYSRGAACANLLGLLCNDLLGQEKVFVYTYATPTTVKKEASNTDAPNIFNHINTADIVPDLPLTAWGFGRAGIDKPLSGNAETAANKQQLISFLQTLSPSAMDYYNTRYSLSGPGVSEDGMTTYEMCLLLIRTVAERDLDQLQETLGAIQVGSAFYPLVSLLGELSPGMLLQAASLAGQHLAEVYYLLLSTGE